MKSSYTKNKLSIILIVLAAIGLFAAIISQKPAQPQTVARQAITEEKLEAKIKVAYCPTMQSVVDKLDPTVKIEFKLAGSSGEALQLLKLNKVNAVIIGRKARSEEIDSSTKEFQADPTATTLAADSYQAIKSKDLNSKIIITSLPLKTASEKYPDLNFVPTNEARANESETNKAKFNKEKVAHNTSDLELVLWKDFDYSQQDLAVIINDSGEKVASFRTPFLYFKTDKADLMTDLKTNLEKIYE